MKNKYLIAIALILIAISTLQAQVKSKYGAFAPTKDTIRVFLVFAEALNDPWYNDENRDGVEDLYDYDDWNPNEMPKYPENWFDSEFTTESAIHARITEYFYQTSFGNFIVLGDYYEDLVQIEYDSISVSGAYQVVDYLHNIGEGASGNIITENEYHLNNSDFDKWTRKSGNYQESIQNTDNNLDFLFVIWRVNKKFSKNGGIFYTYWQKDFINKVGVLNTVVITSNSGHPGSTARHEFAHSLLGFNNFHTCGKGAGAKKVMSIPSGWSLLSLSGNRGEICNAWDQWRLDWKPDGANYDIRALDTNHIVINTDLIYDTTNNTQEYILRDFAATGDALRIKLPYMQSDNTEVFNQYIWLENHQLNEMIEIRKTNSTKGIYAYIQLGKNTREGNELWEEESQYIYPLNAFGNFDMTFTNTTQGTGKSQEEYATEEEWINKALHKSEVYISASLKNPLTGANLLMQHPYNFRNDTIQNVVHTDIITRDEVLSPNKVYHNGVQLPNSDFCYQTYPVFGTRHDAFTVGRKINMSSNPPNTPVYTYETISDDKAMPNPEPKLWDNRKIYLNGLAIELMEQYSNGNIRIKISYNDYEISEDTRWCGDIVLNEKVNLLAGKKITFEQGLTPTRPRFPQIINGEQVFADPTIFNCNKDSEFVQNVNSTVSVAELSTLHLKGESSYLIKAGATLTIKSGSTLKIDNCAILKIEGNGQLILEDHAIVDIGQAAVLAFEDALANVIIGNNISYTNIDITNVLPEHYLITSSTNWNNKNYGIYSDVIISNGVVLSVNNSFLNASSQASLLVTKGGKLVLNNTVASRLLKVCNSTTWKGIVVEGNSNASQIPESNQGVLELNNGSMIEFAEIGVYVGNSSSLMNKGVGPVPTPWNNKSGGIIKLDNAVFKDNISGVEMPSYRHNAADNISYIKNSTFKTTAESQPVVGYPTMPDTFITLWDVGTIAIEGNIFRNELDLLEHPYKGRGMGIKAIDADFNVTQNNLFEKLEYGINVSGTGNLSNASIEGNTFISNKTAIDVMSADNIVINSNDINLETTIHYESMTGAYIIDTEGFSIQENTFFGNPVADFTLNRGLLIGKCKADNTVYNNNFYGLDTGIHSVGINVSDIKCGAVGLKIICNTFDTVVNDIYVAPNSFIDPIQGSITNDAGNIFTPECSGSTNEYNSIDSYITYYTRYTPSNSYPEYNPACHSNKVSITKTEQLNPCESMLSMLVSGSDLVQKQTEINQKQAVLTALTDGGDTQALNETVDEAENTEALNLRNELLSKSPALSDTVMVSATTIEYVLPSLMLKQVLAANPKAAKSEKVQTALDSRQNQLPEYMRVAIDLGKNLLSYKEALESQLSQVISERENMINRRIFQLKQEGSTASLDTLETLLVSEAGTKLNRNYQLVNYYLSHANTQEAQNVFTATPTNFTLSSSEQSKYDKLNQLYSIRFNLESADKSWFEMDSIQKNVVQNLAIDSTSTAGMQARVVLSLVDRMDYGVYIPEIITTNYQTNSHNGPPEMLFKAYPEVATDYFIIEYVLGENENPEEVSMAVFDDKGNQMKQFDVITHANQFLIECENWQEGVYWCRKSVGKRVTEQQKVILNKGGVLINSVATNSVKGSNSLVLFPNPSSGVLFVSFKMPNEPMPSDLMPQSHLILITDSKGATIATCKLKNKLTQIATDTWQQGVYIVSIVANNKVIDTAKIIIE